MNSNVTSVNSRFSENVKTVSMETTQLLPVRTADGRLSYASYKDELEKARIVDWAKAHNAKVGAAALIQPVGLLARIA